MRGIILKTTPLRESDLILTVLTDTEGKLALLAKGARRSKRRFMGGLDLFDCGELTVQPQRAEGRLPLLEAFTERESFLGLRSDLLRLSLASTLLEITTAFTVEGDPEDVLHYAPLHRALMEISLGKDQHRCVSEGVLFLFELLQRAGFNPLHAPELQPKPTDSPASPASPPGPLSLLEVCSAVLHQRDTPSPPSPTTTADLRRALDTLLEFAEQISGITLRTRQHLVLSSFSLPERAV